MRFFDQGQTANARTGNHANPVRILHVDFDAAIMYRLNTGRQPVMDEGIHMTRFFGREIRAEIKAFHLSGETGRKTGCIETGNRGNPRTASEQIRPARLHCISNRRNMSKTCNHNTAAIHALSSLLNIKSHSACENPTSSAMADTDCKNGITQTFTLARAYSTACCTVVIDSASLSGISMPNSSSRDMTSSTVSKESAPRSPTKLDSSLISVTATPSCSATIFLTRCSISSMHSSGTDS